jgi:hypothetical protein
MKVQSTLFAVAGLLLAACQVQVQQHPNPSTAKNKLEANATKSKDSVAAQKPASPTKTTTPPRQLPAAKTAGSTTVAPADPTKGGTVEAITYGFTAVDLDEDGTAESGVVLADEAFTTVVLWWNGSMDLGDGAQSSYEAVLWVTPDGSGFEMDIPGAGSMACIDATCVSCDLDGVCLLEE